MESPSLGINASMWSLETWFRGGFGSAGPIVGLDDLKGFFQPEQLSNSVIL